MPVNDLENHNSLLAWREALDGFNERPSDERVARWPLDVRDEKGRGVRMGPDSRESAVRNSEKPGRRRLTVKPSVPDGPGGCFENILCDVLSVRLVPAAPSRVAAYQPKVLAVGGLRNRAHLPGKYGDQL
jgi:hypothetical protein